MVDVLNILLIVLAAAALTSSAVVLLEVVAAVLPKRRRDVERTNDIRTVVVIPAHNEESTIGGTLEALRSQMTESTRVLVVADNCTDRTAEIARSIDFVDVLERKDEHHRGKGYALAHALASFENDPPDVVVFLDADCVVDEGGLARLSQTAHVSKRPVQAAYLIEAPSQSGAGAQLRAFAVVVKNLVRPRGLARLGAPCLLTGSGMAASWNILQNIKLGSSHIVEDMKLGVDLTIAGYPPQFCEDVVVRSELPVSDAANDSQSRRWEHGHLSVILRETPRLLWALVSRLRLGALPLAFELAVPPLALLVLFNVILLAASTVFGVVASITTPFIIAAVSTSALTVAVFIAWLGWGRSVLSTRAVLGIPAYVVGKIPLYLGFIRRPEQNWVRTERDGKSLNNTHVNGGGQPS